MFSGSMNLEADQRCRENQPRGNLMQLVSHLAKRINNTEAPNRNVSLHSDACGVCLCCKKNMFNFTLAEVSQAVWKKEQMSRYSRLEMMMMLCRKSSSGLGFEHLCCSLLCTLSLPHSSLLISSLSLPLYHSL